MNSKDIQIQGVGALLTVTGLLKVLWNKLFPQLFGWKKITYWQSIMLYLICKALFDFRYTIKDSFNFGNNSINGESVGKKTTPKPAKKDVEPEAKEETIIAKDAVSPKEEVKVEQETEVENEIEEEVGELEERINKL